MEQPTCFISYAWEGDEHRDWVRNLAFELQRNGVITHLDQWDTHPGIDLTHYMETSIRESNFVLLVCTLTFAQKANAGKGGVGYEKSIVTGEIFAASASPKKFVPLIRKGKSEDSLPSYLKSRAYIDFRNDGAFNSSLEELLRHIYRSPKYERPPLGPRRSFGRGDKERSPADEASTLRSVGTRSGEAAKETGSGEAPTKGKHVYCVRCGQKPGTYGSCLAGQSHSYTQFAGPSDSIFCSRCGQRPGTYGSCLAGQSHSYTQFAGSGD
jgi:hypothetical protein